MVLAQAQMITATVVVMCVPKEHSVIMLLSTVTTASFPAEIQVALPVSRNAAMMPVFPLEPARSKLVIRRAPAGRNALAVSAYVRKA
jgi:hypothetical protein